MTRLIRFGFFRELRHGFADAPSLREVLQLAALPQQREIVQYLRTGHVLIASPGIVRDVITGQVIGSLSILTDGVYAWPSDLPHYVERHHALIPAEVVAHMAQNNWSAPGAIDLSSLVLR